MKRFLLTLLLGVLALGVFAPRAGLALARHEPQMKFIGGYVSYWDPTPYTVLDYNGDTGALNALLGTLASTKGLHVGVSFTRGTAANASSGSWRVEYTASSPDRVTVQINLKSDKVDME